MIIQVEVRSVYGNDLIYPANEAARLAAELVGKKSFSARDLWLLCRLGNDIAELRSSKVPALLAAVSKAESASPRWSRPGS